MFTRAAVLLIASSGIATTLGSAAPAPGTRLFSRSDVRLLEGPFLDAQRRDLAYLMSLDPDRLLHTFRLNAGLPTQARPLGGWEAPEVELRGHTLGHYLTACSLLYEATGDERLKQRALAVARELSRVQQALAARGSNPGYLSAFPEEFFDRLEAREGVWAPYYTLHKIMAGLLDVHRTSGDPGSLETLRGMASWVGLRAARLGEAQWQALLETEFGGMQDVLAALHEVTADPEHLRLARLFDHKAVFDPLAHGEDALDGLHANTQIPKAIGAARDCATTGERRYCRVAETLWESVALHRSYAIGGHSDHEHFSPLASLSRHLGPKTAETCNTYNMLKLTAGLYEGDGDPRRMDFYERALFNHILAAQDPATGMMSYHLALAPGAWRTYSTPLDSFWCCVGTGIENPARYGDVVYARQGDALLVNLLLASELEWPEKGLTLRQETRFPDEDRTRLALRLKQPARFALRVRHPAWAGRLEIRLNGAEQSAPSDPGRYASIDREWRDGDVVEVRLPMTLRAEPMPDDPSLVAFLQGPIVLAADLGPAGSGDCLRYGSTAPEMAIEDTPETPVLVARTLADALARVKPTDEPLVFRSERLGWPSEVELRPLFRLADRRYTVYLTVIDETVWAEREARRRAEREEEAAVDSRTVDRVRPGVESEEAAHGLEQKGSAASRFEGRLSRSVFWGNGEFSYLLKLPSAGPAALRFVCWGGESRRHRFEVLAENEVIATQTLFDDRPGEPFALEYALPERLTRGRHSVRVGFRAVPGGSVGAVFDVRTVRPAEPAESRPAAGVSLDHVAAGSPRALVFIRTGRGYVHDNIAASVGALREIAAEHGIGLDVAADASAFTDANLGRYQAVVFSNTNEEAFTREDQRLAFQRFVRKGGGFMGIHSASTSERQWPWYRTLLGGSFAWHPPLQPFTIRVVDRTHPSTSVLPGETWSWEDELYYHRDRDASVHVLLVADARTLKEPGQRPPELAGEPDLVPVAWHHEPEGGRVFYTALGHKPEHYADPAFRAHLAGGLLSVLSKRAR